MGKIVIRKRLSLDFLGDEYKDSYLVFRSIPVADFTPMIKKIKEIGENSVKAYPVVLQYLKDYFIEGEVFDGEKLSKVVADDIDGLDGEAVLVCFGRITGSQPDPKASTQSGTPSTTTPTPQASSSSTNTENTSDSPQ